MSTYSQNLNFFQRKAPVFFDRLMTAEFHHPQLQVLDEFKAP